MKILFNVRRLSAAMDTAWSAASAWPGAFVSAKRWIVVASALMLVAGAMAATMPTTFAANCTGDGCNGVDPYTAQCASGSYDVLTGYFVGGLLELRWSPTCQTNWTRFTPANNEGYEIWVTRLSDGVFAGNGLWYSYFFTNGSGVLHWGDMVYSPGPAQACVRSPQHVGTFCLTQSS